MRKKKDPEKTNMSWIASPRSTTLSIGRLVGVVVMIGVVAFGVVGVCCVSLLHPWPVALLLYFITDFEYYRKLGDVSSSIFALGYHQQVANDELLPKIFGSRDRRHSHTHTLQTRMSSFPSEDPQDSPRGFADFHQSV
jgi:hypothetical protein